MEVRSMLTLHGDGEASGMGLPCGSGSALRRAAFPWRQKVKRPLVKDGCFCLERMS